MTRLRLWTKVAWAALSSRSVQAFYDRISSVYDEAYVTHKVHAENILKVLGDIFSDKDKKTLVLDLGCGTGLLSKMLDREKFNVVALDISYLSLCKLKEHYPGTKVIHADANYLPFSDSSFRAVVCLGVWRHFPDSNKVLKQISRILTPDGAFIVGYFPPAIAGLIHVKQNILGNLIISLYSNFTQKLGYQDRADFLLEVETEKAVKKIFKKVTSIASGLNKHLLCARYPIAKTQDKVT
jgi:ubiquinone/menaquinone biosynthesis C-methylase UbiE